MEETWLREFAKFYGVESCTSFCLDDLGGIPLVQIVEAMVRPTSISCEKCDEPGCVCTLIADVGDGECIAVSVHFVSQEMKVPIRRADRIKKETDSDTSQAA